MTQSANRSEYDNGWDAKKMIEVSDSYAESKNPCPEGPALVRPGGVKGSELPRRRAAGVSKNTERPTRGMRP